MKTNLKFFVLASVLIALSAISCNKDNLDEVVLPQNVESTQVSSGNDGNDGQDGTDGTDGEQGPQGETGPQGEQGEPGPQGEQGPQGETGPQGEQGEPGTQGETGAQGPAGHDGEDGATGPTGPQGDTGATGPAGADGEDGNANVIASDWLEPTESSFSVNNPRIKALPLATGMSSNIIADGVFLVYYDNDIQVSLLPRHSLSLAGTMYKSIDSHINHASRTLYVTIRSYTSDLTSREYLWNASAPIYSRGVRFRYVIIPSSASGKSSIDLEKMSYEEVMDHFGLAH